MRRRVLFILMMIGLACPMLQAQHYVGAMVDGAAAWQLDKEDITTPQLGAGTSVGANIHEAQYAQSKKDFVAKLEIALKESNETSYWLKLMYETERIDIATYQYTEKLCGNIRRLLIASCKTAKENVK